MKARDLVFDAKYHKRIHKRLEYHELADLTVDELRQRSNFFYLRLKGWGRNTHLAFRQAVGTLAPGTTERERRATEWWDANS